MRDKKEMMEIESGISGMFHMGANSIVHGDFIGISHVTV